MAAPPRVEPHNGREVPVGVPLRDVEDSEGKFDLKKKQKKKKTWLRKLLKVKNK